MPLVTPKRAIKAVFIISAIGFIVVDVSILLREDDVSASAIVNAVDARIQQKLDSAVHNFSVGANGNFIHRERSRLLHQMANASRRNHTNTSHPTNQLPRVSHMSGNLSEIRAAMLAANRQQNIANLDVFDLVASDSAIVIVIQVHNRVEYLRHLVSSLRKAVDIEQTLLVFSHDFYSDELNDIVASIDFCPVCSFFTCRFIFLMISNDLFINMTLSVHLALHPYTIIRPVAVPSVHVVSINVTTDEPTSQNGGKLH